MSSSSDYQTRFVLPVFLFFFFGISFHFSLFVFVIRSDALTVRTRCSRRINTAENMENQAGWAGKASRLTLG